MNLPEYFKNLEEDVHKIYDLAAEARKKGLDPVSDVEISLASSLAERAIGVVETKYPQLKNEKIINRIKDLEKEFGLLDPVVCLTIAEEVAKEKFCKFRDLLEGIDAGMRVGMAYWTLGVVSSPLEGYTNFTLKKTKDGKDFFSVYYSGPIRSAGATGAAFSLIIIDYLRKLFGFAKYDPTEEEVKRASTELYDYHERITNLQYLPPPEEIEFMMKHLPIMPNGDPSEDKEISNYKDLPRIETNTIRSGFCLILGEGICQKAPKISRILNKLKQKGFEFEDWNFLEDFILLQKKLKEKKETGSSKGGAVYIKDLVAGRPVLGHPSRSGSFRLRYGRSRFSGYSALSIHPATMIILNKFLAIGTQIKIEKPTKGSALTSCDSIDGPIIKLKDGSVRKIDSVEDAEKYFNEVKEIIYCGDLLVPYGDFANRNHVLEKPGYVEEYWYQHLKQKNSDLKLNFRKVSLEEAKNLSETYKIPLHPNFIFYWSQINKNDLDRLLDWIKTAKLDEEKLILNYQKSEYEKLKEAKRALEVLGVPHLVTTENVVIEKPYSSALLLNLNLNSFADIGKIKEKLNSFEGNVLQFINSKEFLGFEIRDKAGTFIGARMGRPEKAKLRKLTGSPNVLFPVGEQGGKMRSLQKALEDGYVKADFPLFFCEKCNKETIYFICEDCKSETKKIYYCSNCGRNFSSDNCPIHGKAASFTKKRINIAHYFEAARTQLNLSREETPVLIKGVKGISSVDHIPEHLSKGILRSMFNLHVNKDGTIRYDATELPITHFKPKEIGTSIEKLKQLGYLRDIENKPLENGEQILEIKPHDVLLPSCPNSLDEPADKVFLNIANFIDNLLVRFYNLKPFFNATKKEDLIGHLVLCIAPHNVAGVVGRIIGFSKIQAMVASPYMHAAMRRDCDGDEAAFILLMDALLNFSKKYLPGYRGATQDAPLVLNIRIRPGEVDDMIFDMDVMTEYPLELYEAAEQGKMPDEIKIEQIKHRLGDEIAPFRNFGFTHGIENINSGVLCSAYKTLANMQQKVEKQMDLATKIRAVDESDVARLVIERHFIRDIRGNLRKFFMQGFRCVDCNEKFRRPPLIGNCTKCNGKIIFTINKGGIVKYLQPALDLAENFNVSSYIKESLELTKNYVESVFGKEKERQEDLKKWFS